MNAPTDALERSRRPPPGEPRPLHLPTFRPLDAGTELEARVAPRSGVPEVSLRLVLEAGATTEPAERGGLAELTGRLLTEGAGDRDAMGVARWIDRLGAAFDVSVGYDVTVLSMHVLPEVLGPALEFLATVVREPRFYPQEVERVRSERLDEIEREQDEPAIVADHAVVAALYGDAPYGRPVGGTRDSVALIDADAVRGLHEERYAPTGSLLLACGDVAEDGLRTGLARWFGDWRGRAERPPPPGAPERPVTGARVILIDRPDGPQAELRVAAVGAPHGTDDHHAIVMANAILGGLFNSRINMNLREEKGWTYGARSTFRFRRGPGPFVARTAVETAVAAAALEEVLAEIARMREEPPTDDEMRLAANALTLSLPRHFETAAQVTRRVARQFIYDLPHDYWERYRERIEAVTPERVRDACRSYLAEERLVLLAVADDETVAPELERLGPLERRPAPGTGRETRPA